MESAKDIRFQGFRQLIGASAFERIAEASVCIVGLGGVGSWVAEALARSGIGALTLVDLDEICVTNMNRQIQALSSNIGRFKAEVLAERVKEINPDCKVKALKKFFTNANANEVLGDSFDLVMDTIDSVDHKTELILECVKRDLRVISVGSGGDRLDPLAARVEDFAFTVYDPMLQIVRKRLRRHHNFPRGERKRFEIPCVYAPQQRGPRLQTACDTKKTKKSCNDGLGSAVFVTGTIGMIAAAEAVKLLVGKRREVAYPWKKKRWQASEEKER